MAASLIDIIDSLNSRDLMKILKELSLSVQPGGPKGTLDPNRIQPSLKSILDVVESIESSQHDKEIKEVANASHEPKIDLLRKIFSFFSLSENFKLFFSKLSTENSNILYRERQERADKTKLCFNDLTSHIKDKTDGLRDEVEKENSISEIFRVKHGPANAIEEMRPQEYPYSHMIPPNLLEELFELQGKALSIVNSEFPLANRIEGLAKLYQYYESGLNKQVEIFLLPGQELFNFFLNREVGGKDFFKDVVREYLRMCFDYVAFKIVRQESIQTHKEYQILKELFSNLSDVMQICKEHNNDLKSMMIQKTIVTLKKIKAGLRQHINKEMLSSIGKVHQNSSGISSILFEASQEGVNKLIAEIDGDIKLLEAELEKEPVFVASSSSSSSSAPVKVEPKEKFGQAPQPISSSSSSSSAPVKVGPKEKFGQAPQPISSSSSSSSAPVKVEPKEKFGQAPQPISLSSSSSSAPVKVQPEERWGQAPLPISLSSSSSPAPVEVQHDQLNHSPVERGVSSIAFDFRDNVFSKLPDPEHVRSPDNNAQVRIRNREEQSPSKRVGSLSVDRSSFFSLSSPLSGSRNSMRSSKDNASPSSGASPFGLPKKD